MFSSEDTKYLYDIHKRTQQAMDKDLLLEKLYGTDDSYKALTKAITSYVPEERQQELLSQLWTIKDILMTYQGIGIGYHGLLQRMFKDLTPQQKAYVEGLSQFTGEAKK